MAGFYTNSIACCVRTLYSVRLSTDLIYPRTWAVSENRLTTLSTKEVLYHWAINGILSLEFSVCSFQWLMQPVNCKIQTYRAETRPRIANYSLEGYRFTMSYFRM